MKHSYSAGCDCPRCQKERARRTVQAQAENLRSGGTRYASREGIARARIAMRRRPKPHSRTPVPGSQEWAETRGDDLGLSPDR
jgi:hypothetical protein